MKLEQRFNSKYGDGAFARFRDRLTDPTISYTQIGREFSITRQRVSQIALLLQIDGKRRFRKRTGRRAPYFINENAKYPARVRYLLAILKQLNIPFTPYYQVRKQGCYKVSHKSLVMIYVNGVLCRVGCRAPKVNVPFVIFPISAEMLKAKAVVWGIKHGTTVRIYVIPTPELKHVRFVYIPMNGTYSRRSREPIRNWTMFENAWHLLNATAR